MDADIALMEAWSLGEDRDGWSEDVMKEAERLLPTLIEAGYAETSGNTWNFTPTGVARAVQLQRDVRLDGVEVVSFIDWYDGPLSGVARYQDAEYWFEAEGRKDYGFALRSEDRRFFLYPITAEELAEEAYWQRLYDEHVAGDKPESEKWRFYDPYEKRQAPDYASRQAIGWFMEK